MREDGGEVRVSQGHCRGALFLSFSDVWFGGLMYYEQGRKNVVERGWIFYF